MNCQKSQVKRVNVCKQRTMNESYTFHFTISIFFSSISVVAVQLNRFFLTETFITGSVIKINTRLTYTIRFFFSSSQFFFIFQTFEQSIFLSHIFFYQENVSWIDYKRIKAMLYAMILHEFYSSLYIMDTLMMRWVLYIMDRFLPLITYVYSKLTT